MTLDSWLVATGDALIFLGFVVTWLFYRLERRASKRRDDEAVLAMLEAVRDGLAAWAGPYFGKSYTEATAWERAAQDFAAVMAHSFMFVFRVPTEPLVAMIRRPGVGKLVRKETIEATNVALWEIGKFNQFVQLQTDFYARHLAEILDPALPKERRRPLAEAARDISFMIEWHGVGDGVWYRRLTGALDENIQSLKKALS
jgi:hypothetical protein